MLREKLLSFLRILQTFFSVTTNVFRTPNPLSLHYRRSKLQKLPDYAEIMPYPFAAYVSHLSSLLLRRFVDQVGPFWPLDSLFQWKKNAFALTFCNTMLDYAISKQSCNRGDPQLHNPLIFSVRISSHCLLTTVDQEPFNHSNGIWTESLQCSDFQTDYRYKEFPHCGDNSNGRKMGENTNSLGKKQIAKALR